MPATTLPWYRAWAISLLHAVRSILDWAIQIFSPTNPVITEFTPASGHPGTLVVIRGIRFSEKREDNEVLIGGSAAQVFAASATELRVITHKAGEFEHRIHSIAIDFENRNKNTDVRTQLI